MRSSGAAGVLDVQQLGADAVFASADLRLYLIPEYFHAGGLQSMRNVALDCLRRRMNTITVVPFCGFPCICYIFGT